MLRSDSLLKLGPQTPALIYLNSPANPHGQVLGVDHLRKFVEFARERGTIIVSDECYLGLGWGEERPVSILDPEVCGGDFTNLIAVHSLSKTSNLASYRAGWLAGDGELIQELLDIRRHAGLMNPGPIQSAMVAAPTATAVPATPATTERRFWWVMSICPRPPGSIMYMTMKIAMIAISVAIIMIWSIPRNSACIARNIPPMAACENSRASAERTIE